MSPASLALKIFILATSASNGPRFQKLSSIYSDCAVRMRGFVTGVSAESGPLSSPEQLL